MNGTRVSVVLPLLVGLAHCFSWDIVLGGQKTLEFFYNGTLMRTENPPSANRLTAITYDPVLNRVLFADYNHPNTSISYFDLTTRETKTLVTRTRISEIIRSLAYDPVTQIVFWSERSEIYSFSLKSAVSNEAGEANIFLTLTESCDAVAVDSCGGFIYWITNHEIERAAFDGSNREVLVDDQVFWRRGLTIDQQTQKMYWLDETTETQYSLKSADLNGHNKRTVYFMGRQDLADSLVVSNDFIYWKIYNRSVLQLPKGQHGVGPIVNAKSSSNCWSCQLTAANYTVMEQTLGIKRCEALNSVLRDEQERFRLICHNYCMHGDCSVSVGRLPKCRCNAGYSGKRCEVNMCHQYCLNSGVCSLNQKVKQVCRCSADYEGDRCEIPAVLKTCNQTVSV